MQNAVQGDGNTIKIKKEKLICNQCGCSPQERIIPDIDSSGCHVRDCYEYYCFKTGLQLYEGDYAVHIVEIEVDESTYIPF